MMRIRAGIDATASQGKMPIAKLCIARSAIEAPPRPESTQALMDLESLEACELLE
jgi:hypothetical protein